MANPQVPQQPDPMQDGVAFRKFAGIKNVVNRERLGPDELEKAVNIDLDDLDQPHRRRGYKNVWVEPTGSLWSSDEGTVYGVKDGFLGIINPDHSFFTLQAGYINARVCYVQVGKSVYFSAGDAGLAGIIDQDARTISPWGTEPDIFLSPVVRPTATLPAIRGRLIGKPPFATALTYFNGRIYLAHERWVWATELFLYNFVEKVANYLPFDADTTMLGSVTDGLYVGTTEGLWFVSGPTFKEMKRIRVMDTGVVPGTMIYIPQEVANPPQVGLDQSTPVSVSIMFMTAQGYCTAREGGQVYNETENKVVFPAATSGAAGYRFQDGVHTYLAVLNSGGTPSINARIGDYIDAELVRAGTWRELTDGARVIDTITAEKV